MNPQWLVPLLLSCWFAACGGGGDWAVEHLEVPQHPYLAQNGRSNMHDDAYMTDTYRWDGPAGTSPRVELRSYAEQTNTCATIAFDSRGRIVTTSAVLLSFSIMLADADTLEPLATYQLAPRDPTDPLFPYDDTSGAAYFVLDRDERIIFSDAENAVQIIGYDGQAGALRQIDSFDLSDHMVEMTPPARDHVQMAIPDWAGKYLWFTTRYGMVGTLEEKSGRVRVRELAGEQIENSFAVGEDGVYVVTDHAMYRFSDADGVPQIDWRTEYDRGSGLKPGNINQGSGTTPQLFGEMVAIGDNAEPRMNVIFLRRKDGSVACQVPVFDDGQSTTENALVGWDRRGPGGIEYSVIVDNNYGIDRNNILGEGRSWREHVGGLARIDMLPDGNGGFTCAEIWRSPEKSSQVLPKLSLSNGLLYIYTYEPMPDGDYDFFLTALEFDTGAVSFRVPTGHGLDYANFGQPLALSPDGAAYLGTMNGLLRIADRVP